MASQLFAPIYRSLGELTLPFGVALGALLLLLVARRLLLHGLGRLVWRGRGLWAEHLAASLRTPTLLWCLALSLAAGLEAASLPPRLAAWSMSLIVVLIILSVTLVAADVGTRYLRHLAERQRIDAVVSGLGMTLSKALIFTLGGLVTLSTLGIAITPLVATLGIGGIAVALAFQDILSNLFAGVYLIGGRPLRVGDHVKLETGQEGTVADIGWRTTYLRVPPNHTLIVPNNKLIQSILTLRDPENTSPTAPALTARGDGVRR